LGGSTAARERAFKERRSERLAAHPETAESVLLSGFFGAALDGREGLTAVIQEAYIQDISTRSVDDLVKALGMSGISKSQISRLCEEIDERVKASLDQLIEGEPEYAACPRRALSSDDPRKDRALASDAQEPDPLENYYLPSGLETQIKAFVADYNHLRYHESIGNLTPADVYVGRGQTILIQRERIKRQTIANRLLLHRQQAA
jgi:Transposase, Mutator family